MMQIDLNSIAQYGIFAVLFVWLLQDTTKKSDKREEWLKNHLNQSQKINQDTAETLKLMKVEIKEELTDIKNGFNDIKDMLLKGDGQK